MLLIASDHAGFELKQQLIEYTNLDFLDLGPHNSDSVDYPNYAHMLCGKITKSQEHKVIFIFYLQIMPFSCWTFLH